MKLRWIILSCGIVCLAACDSSEKALVDSAEENVKPASFHVFIEAEACEVLGEKAEDAKASGLASVKTKPGSAPALLRCDIPASGKTLSIWLRRKGGAVQISTTSGDVIEGRLSAIVAEEQFAWTLFGEIPSGEEGRELIVSGDGKETVFVDGILFCEDPLSDKDALLTPLPPVSIDPANTTGGFRSAPNLWGVNVSSASAADLVGDVASHSPGLVRLSSETNMGEPDNNPHGLFDSETRDWDAQKIRGAVQSLLNLGDDSKIFINIPNWPEWMDADGDGFLDDDKNEDYVTMVGRFAEIVWEIPAARSRVLFEIGNGLDEIFYEKPVGEKKPHRIAELGRLFIQCSLSIRSAVPDARVGGPSAGNGLNTAFHEQFIALTAPELDFYSFHLHAGGDSQESDSRILLKADEIADSVNQVEEILGKNSRGRKIPVFVSEYGFGLSDDAETPKIGSGFDTVCNAWSAMSLFAAGAESAAISYPSYKTGGKRLSSEYLTNVLNSEFKGSIASLDTGDPEDISALVTEGGEHILICHRGLRARKINIPKGKWKGWIVSEGMDMPQEISAEAETDLPGISVLYLAK